MDWQEIVALIIVATTASLLLWQKFRPRKFNFQRDTHCGCSAGGSGPRESITYRARKGERARIVVTVK